MHEPRRNLVLRAKVSALANPRTLANPVAKVIKLCATHIAPRSDLNLLNLWRVERECSLNTDTKRLLADNECLTCAITLTADYNALEDLGTTASTFNYLKVNFDSVARIKIWYAAQLCAFKIVDDCAHSKGGSHL